MSPPVFEAGDDVDAAARLAAAVKRAGARPSEALEACLSGVPCFDISTPPMPLQTAAELEAALAQLRSYRAVGEAEEQPLLAPSKAAGFPSVYSISTPPPEPEDGAASVSTEVGDGEDVPVIDLSADFPEDDAGDALTSPGDRERRLLCDLLWVARPRWVPRDLAAAERKLLRVGVASVRELLEELVAGDLNERLRSAGLQPFGGAALEEFRTRAQRVAEEGERAVLCRATWRNDAPRPGRGQAARGRLLCEVLWESRPAWTPADLSAAERKLALVGIEDVGSLDGALTAGLNKRLREAGLKTFSADTVAALRKRLDEAYGRVDMQDKQAAWMHSSGRPLGGAAAPAASLRDVLWESRPTWSASELSAAEHKLAQVGVASVASLAEALGCGLNRKLKEAGLKAFGAETLRELRRRVAVALPARGGAAAAGRGPDDEDAAGG